MPKNPTTALVKTNQPPTLARVSSQLALTDKLLAKRVDKENLTIKGDGFPQEHFKRK